MQINRKITVFLILTALVLLLAGCPLTQQPVEIVLKSDSIAPPRSSTESTRKFQHSSSGNPSIVESAMELSGKYVKLSEDIAVLRQEKQGLVAENRLLKEQFAPCQKDLEQTQKELAQANDLLIETRIELNNWKTSILGYRDEMRQADSAQLEALLKILTILGGEVKQESASNEAVDSDAALAQTDNLTFNRR